MGYPSHIPKYDLADSINWDRSRSDIIHDLLSELQNRGHLKGSGCGRCKDIGMLDWLAIFRAANKETFTATVSHLAGVAERTLRTTKED